ncbi:14875_t:CDS:1, partial [Racocetra persica]
NDLYIQKKSPSQPIEDIIDITPSLEYITLIGHNKDITIQDLTKKTTFLIAITSASRPSDLYHISLESMTKIENGFSLDIVSPKEYNISLAHR